MQDSSPNMTRIRKILADPNDKLIAVDLDGVLCDGEFWFAANEPKPFQDMIDKITNLYQKGAHIIIYTARQPKYLPETQAWLIKHRVPFHGIAMQVKIGADVYIDDKTINSEHL